ncbi:hypothetical protein ABN203_19615, partial [Morganella morganii]
AARCIISGRGLINSVGCYPKSGVLHDWNKCSILSPMINKLANCSGQWGDTRGWEVKTPGSNFSVTTSSDVPTSKIFHSSFSAWVNSGAFGGMTQTVKVNESGRWLQFGFWGKSEIGDATLNVYAYDSASNRLPWMSTSESLKLYCPNWTAEWKFYAMVQPIPDGCDSVVIEFSFVGNGRHLIHNVICGVI